MEFDKSKVYTALNADELTVGSKCIFADTVLDLRQGVQSENMDCLVCELTEIRGDGDPERFTVGDTNYLLAYLIEPPKEPQYKPFSNIENLKKAVVKCKGFIKTKQGVREGIIIGLSFDNEAIIKTRWGVSYSTFEQLFKSYIFDDGSPCGELAED